MRSGRVNAAILGSGNIGTDLLMKIRRSKLLRCALFIGRKMSSPNIRTARELGIAVSDRGIDAILEDPSRCDIVFDATSASEHAKHAPVLKALGKFTLDMTPSKVGTFCIPAINMDDCLRLDNLNMVTCGGQAAVPIAYAIGQSQREVDYIEIVSSIASKSAGPATRLNLDEYIETTEQAMIDFSGCRRSKAILNLNPAIPCIDMQTTLFASVPEPDMPGLAIQVRLMVDKIRRYVPGYRLIMPPTMENGRIVIMCKVRGAGDFLPAYAGNLDIINCAAIAMAERYAGNRWGEGGIHEPNHRS